MLTSVGCRFKKRRGGPGVMGLSMRRADYEFVSAGKGNGMLGLKTGKRDISVDEIVSLLSSRPELMAEVATRLGPDVIREVVNVSRFLPFMPKSPPVREEFQALRVGAYGLQRLLDDWQFESIVDIGAGLGHHAAIMRSYGKQVTEVDLGRTPNFELKKEGDRHVLVGDIYCLDPPQQYDCLWASHILEHQPNVQQFIGCLKQWVKDEGVMAITVPPLKNEVVSGHLNLFTPGHLLYQLAVAGLDCSEAVTYAYNYNITVIVRKKCFEVPDLSYDAGDIGLLKTWLPSGLTEGIDGFSTTFVERTPDPNAGSSHAD